ncbi:MAG: penicillin-binding protein activator LpoB [Proteobacteria bacterium]|nr:penicillin-binding protein activator LpoB [Pseudomonadota bacterium]
MIIKKLSQYLSLLSIVLAFACSTHVTRQPTDKINDISGRWNDTDSKIVATFMVDDFLKQKWIHRFENKQGRMPRVIIGKINNRSHEHIAVQTFVKEIENRLINSGGILFVASQDERKSLRAERRDYQEKNQDPAGTKFIAETKADFILQGSIHSMIDQVTKTSVVSYQIDLELLEIDTHIKIWTGQKKIKKKIEKTSVSW